MKKINTKGFNLAYNRHGKGTPLVLIHGYPLDRTIWNDLLPLLENDFDVILPDLRGFGDSDVVESLYKISDMASDIADLLDALSIEKAFVVGHSMGGYISLAFARAYSQRVLGLGLVSSQAMADTLERKQGRYATAAEIIKTGVGPVTESFPALLTPDQKVQVIVRDIIAKQSPAGLASALKAMAERDDSSSILSGFGFPVVIAHGDADSLIPIQRAREINDAIPHSTFLELPEVGHMPMMESPKEVASALKYFLLN